MILCEVIVGNTTKDKTMINDQKNSLLGGFDSWKDTVLVVTYENCMSYCSYIVKYEYSAK